MTAQKFLTNGSGQLTEVQAIDTSAGAADAGKIPCLDAGGKIAENMMPSGVSAETQTATAANNLLANDLVYFYLDGATLKVDKADASDGTKRAQGYVKAGVTAGNPATVWTDSYLPGTGLTPGAPYYLSESAGLNTATPPTTSGAMVQTIGIAVSETAIKFDPDRKPIILV